MAIRQQLAYVTGAEGFLGRHVSRLLDSEGWYVVGVGHHGMPADQCREWGIGHSVHGDVSPSLLLEARTRHGAPALVVHLAGTASVARASIEPFKEFVRTVESTAAIAEFVSRHAPSARVIYASSAAVYGNGWHTPIPSITPASPISVYGIHKHLAETLLLDICRISGVECRIVRFFSLYGPGLKKQIMWDIANRVLAGEESLSLSGTGEETRDFLFVEDAARIIHLLTLGSPHSPQIVNGGTGAGLRISELVPAIVSALGKRATIEFSGIARTGDPIHLVADVQCLQALGFSPTWTLGRGLSEVARWIRSEDAAEATGSN